ncbi:MAG TPA: hypothetical protein QGF35_02025 [Dehalococcoidia bacterium]|nr:hypothetical protein [Dehalococcoidia bacterium]
MDENNHQTSSTIPTFAQMFPRGTEGKSGHSGVVGEFVQLTTPIAGGSYDSPTTHVP